MLLLRGSNVVPGNARPRCLPRLLPTLLLPLLLAADTAAAQSAAVFVRVTGPDGPVAGATVEALLGDSVAATTATDEAGVARMVGLRGGTYRVRVSALGHAPRVFEGVRVGPGQARVVDVELTLAPVELEGIRAVTDRIQIQRQNTDFSTTVEQVAMELLPLAYEPAEVVALTPGARPGHVWGGANFQANSYTLDGLSINHPGLGGDLVEPSMSWVERVEVRGLGAGAEYGGFQGGLVNVVTRSGSNDFRGMVRVTHENDELNASNLVSSEIGQEVATRYDVEGQVSGAVVADRLFYFLSGQRIVRDSRVLNHLGATDSRYSPVQEEWTEHKVFGKLTWSPGWAGLFELSGGWLDARAENYGMNGYEQAGAAHSYEAPTAFAGLRWHHAFSTWGSVDARVNHFSRDERQEAYQGTAVPGIRTFSLTPPFTAFGNAPFTLRSAPSSSSANVMATLRLPSGEHEHLLKVGGEVTRGGFLDRRIRNGGMTWMPPGRPGFDPSDPGTWTHASTSFVPSQWGGEVHLDADVLNVAAFAQASLSLGSRIVLSPGIRWGQWTGWLTPRSGDRFRAVQDEGWDPRVGLTVELDGEGSLVAKGHWGRYHQNMIAQMFDRAEGADVFTNEEIWYYWGPELTDPATRFTEAERDAMADDGLFRHESTIVLNETGPVGDYSQPYIDQWLVGLEKQFGNSVKLEAVYTRRMNHDMIALVDRNRADNYVLYENVRVYGSDGRPLPYEGGSVWIEELYVPTSGVINNLKFCAYDALTCAELNMMPPGFELGDTLALSWNPDYVLTNAPDAKREFGQLQLSLEVARPTWGGSVSVVYTSLKGNLDNVSGYSDPAEYGAGPYVRVNEGVNAYGYLSNYAQREAKASVWGMLPWQLRGGLVWNYATGDHYSPRFRISGMGFYQYRANDGVNPGSCSGWQGCPAREGGENVDWRMLTGLEGHHVFIGPRGQPNLETRASFDIRLDRTIEMRGFDVRVSAVMFNIFGQETPTQLNTMVNHGRNFYYFLDAAPGVPWGGTPENQYFLAVLDRVQPRTLRLGMAVEF